MGLLEHNPLDIPDSMKKVEGMSDPDEDSEDEEGDDEEGDGGFGPAQGTQVMVDFCVHVSSFLLVFLRVKYFCVHVRLCTSCA